jgi:hypothetical protein
METKEESLSDVRRYLIVKEGCLQYGRVSKPHFHAPKLSANKNILAELLGK